MEHHLTARNCSSTLRSALYSCCWFHKLRMSNLKMPKRDLIWKILERYALILKHFNDILKMQSIPFAHPYETPLKHCKHLWWSCFRWHFPHSSDFGFSRNCLCRWVCLESIGNESLIMRKEWNWMEIKNSWIIYVRIELRFVRIRRDNLATVGCDCTFPFLCCLLSW